MQQRRDQLRQRGHVVVSTWHDSPDHTQGMGPDEIAKDWRRAVSAARMDLDQISMSDLVIVDSTVPSTTGGFHFEAGFALAKDKMLALIGPRTGVFFANPLIGVFQSWEALMEWTETGVYP